MDGTIDFKSTEGEGSLFWIEIPTAPEDLAPPIPAELPPQNARLDASDAELLPISVLYIEDNQTNQQLMIEVCALRDGISIDCADTAEAGLEYLSKRPVDMVLMDLQLPGMDGYEALQRLRELPGMADKPVIAVSANAMPTDVRKGIEAGFLDYLTKPIEINEFLSVMDSVRLKR